MRTRFIYAPNPTSVEGQFPANNSLKPITWPTSPTSSLPESWKAKFVSTTKRLQFFEFADELSKRNTRATWNNFQHYKMQVLYPSSTGVMTSAPMGIGLPNPYGYRISIPCVAASVNSGFGGDADPIYGLTPLYIKSGGIYSIVPISGLSTLQLTALRAMLPGIRPRLFSLAELYQLKDFGSIRDTAQRASSLISQITGKPGLEKYTKKLLKGFARKLPLSKLLLVLPADIYLQWKFNIAPLLGDIAAVKSNYATVTADVDKLRRQEGILQTRHFSRDLSSAYRYSQSSFSGSRSFGLASVPPEQTYSIKGKAYNYAPSGVSVIVTEDRRETSYDSCSFHAALQYSYHFSKIQRETLMHDAVLDRFGIGVNPIKELWELVPWSFVVDWVVDVSRFLESCENKHVKPVTVIHNWCWSQNLVRKTKIFSTFKSNYPNPEISYYVPDAGTRVIHEEAYKRSTSGLTLTPALSGSGIDSNEFILATALALSRWR